MKRSRKTISLLTLLAAGALILFPARASADPTRYPEFAQQKLPDNITPEFISVEELAVDLKAGKKPLIIDVRSEEEYREVHILSAVSAPLGEFTYYVNTMPRDRPLVLY